MRGGYYTFFILFFVVRVSEDLVWGQSGRSNENLTFHICFFFVFVCSSSILIITITFYSFTLLALIIRHQIIGFVS